MRANAEPPNDNVAARMTLDDVLILVALVAMLVGVLWLAWYVFGGTDDVLGLLRR